MADNGFRKGDRVVLIRDVNTGELHHSRDTDDVWMYKGELGTVLADNIEHYKGRDLLYVSLDGKEMFNHWWINVNAFRLEHPVELGKEVLAWRDLATGLEIS